MKPFFEVMNYSNFTLFVIVFISYYVTNYLIYKIEILLNYTNHFRIYDIVVILFFFCSYFVLMYQMGNAKIEKEINEIKTRNDLEIQRYKEINSLLEQSLKTKYQINENKE